MAIYVFLILLHVCYLSFSRNFGKEAAMYAGFQNVKGDFVAVMDADLQDPPQLLPEMLEIIKSGEYDSVAARRAGRKGEPVLRSALARGFYWIMNRISDTDIARDFRLMKKEMADAVAEMGEYNRFSKGIFGWVGFRTYWMPYENVQRLAGKSKWNFWKLFRYAVDGILNFSHVPLHISSFFGGVMTFAAFILLIAVVIWRICFGDPVAGWASMICAVIFMGGIQLFCMGIMGQYVAKIYMESKHRPHYIIAESSREGTKKLDECRKVFLFWFIQGNRNISLLHNGMKL
ncbi:MAG: glycosyltransferase family 2 protein [Eubacterium sp.]|nr:glycosyltransferase family 2 protein [Eubacterium sp.]